MSRTVGTVQLSTVRIFTQPYNAKIYVCTFILYKMPKVCKTKNQKKNKQVYFKKKKLT